MASDDQESLLERELFLRALLPAKANRAMLKQLTAQMRAVEVPKGGVLYAEGQDDGLIRFLVRGAVELRNAETEPLRLDAPAILGFFDILLHRPHTRTAHALTDLSALWLRQQDWFDSLEDHFDAATTAILRSTENVLRIHLDAPPTGGYPEPPPPSQDDPSPGLNLLERTLALRAVTFFEGATVHALAELAQASDERLGAPDEVLFREAEPVRSIFIVASGVVRVERADPKLVARFGRGSLVGGAAALSATKAPFTASCETPTVLLELGQPTLFDAIEDHVEMIRSILAGVARERDDVERWKGRRSSAAKLTPDVSGA